MATPARPPAEPAPSARGYDPELLAVRATLPVVDPLDLAEHRAATAAQFARFVRVSDDEVAIEDHWPDGPGPRLRVYRPPDATVGGLLWVHGGAFALGAPEIDDDLCRELALDHRLLVVSPDYRLAPEHPWPAAEQDCAAALTWLEDALRRSAIARPPLVAGASAGGALALRTTLDALADGRAVDRLLLAYPVVGTPARPGSPTASMDRYATAPVFDAQQASLMWDRYLPAVTAGRWRSPLDDDHLPRLPLTMVVTTEHDPLRDEGLHLVLAMLQAGVSVQAVNVAGAFHAFDRFAPDSALTHAFRRMVSEFLARPAPVAADW